MLTVATSVGFEPFLAAQDNLYSVRLGTGDDWFENVPAPELVHESCPPVTKQLFTLATVQETVVRSSTRTRAGLTLISTVGGEHDAEQLTLQLSCRVRPQLAPLK